MTPSPTRKFVFAGLALLAAGCVRAIRAADAGASSRAMRQAKTEADSQAIRPFHAHVPQEALEDLRSRIAATHWPGKETVDDPSQGVQLARIQELVRYWGTGYDWRQAEAKLNALPQFMTNI